MSISAKAPNFTLSEFERVSVKPLDATARDHAKWHAEILQRVRNAINATWAPPESGGDWQVHVTSFLRSSESSDHFTGAGIDWNVRDRFGNRNDTLTKWGRDWFAQTIPSAFAELIYEPAFEEGPNAWAHVHHARSGFSRDDSANETPQILDLTRSGEFVTAAIDFIPKPAQPIAIAFALTGIFFLAEAVLKRA